MNGIAFNDEPQATGLLMLAAPYDSSFRKAFYKISTIVVTFFYWATLHCVKPFPGRWSLAMLTRLLILIVFVAATPSVQSQTTSFRLSNGVPETLNTIEQAKDIAMEAAYDVGFLREPEGMVQASHLLEHLMRAE